MTESMSAYKANVLAPLLKALSDEPDDVIFSARAMPSEEYEQLLFLGYPWLEDRIHKQLTFPGLWSLKAPIFDTAVSQFRNTRFVTNASILPSAPNAGEVTFDARQEQSVPASTIPLGARSIMASLANTALLQTRGGVMHGCIVGMSRIHSGRRRISRILVWNAWRGN